VRELLARGAAVDAALNDGRTLLLIASEAGHLEVVRELLARGAAVDAARDDGATPLLVASQKGHLEVVRELLSRGAAVNAAAYGGFTPLYVASVCGHLEVVRELLARGAAVDGAANVGAAPPLPVPGLVAAFGLTTANSRPLDEALRPSLAAKLTTLGVVLRLLAFVYHRQAARLMMGANLSQEGKDAASAAPGLSARFDLLIDAVTHLAHLQYHGAHGSASFAVAVLHRALANCLTSLPHAYHNAVEPFTNFLIDSTSAGIECPLPSPSGCTDFPCTNILHSCGPAFAAPLLEALTAASPAPAAAPSPPPAAAPMAPHHGGGGGATSPSTWAAPPSPRPPVDLTLPRNFARAVLGLYDHPANFPGGVVPDGATSFQLLWRPSCPQQDRRCYRCFAGFHGSAPPPCSTRHASTSPPCGKLPAGKAATHFFNDTAITNMRVRMVGECPPVVKAAGGEANWCAFRDFLRSQ
jgi:hypothetical protein